MNDLDVTISRLLGEVRSGQDVALEMEGPRQGEVLDGLASALHGLCRVVRVAAPATGAGSSLGMSGFIAQVAGGEDVAAQDDAVLERGYRALATPERPGGQIALLVSGAERLQRPVLRFIQHVARGAGSLVLVMAGTEGWLSALNAGDFSTLRSRLGAPPAASVVSAHETPPVEPIASVTPSLAGPQTAVPTRLLGAPGWCLAGLGMAASVVFGMWIGGHRSPQVAVTQTDEASPSLAASLLASNAPKLAPVPATKPASLPEPKVDPPAPITPVSVPAAAPERPSDLSPSPSPLEASRAADAAAPEQPRSAEAVPAQKRPTRHAEARPREQAPRRAVARSVVRQPAGEPDESDEAAGYGSRSGPAWERPVLSPYGGGTYNQGPYIGTYMADQYGVRRFRSQQALGD